ncbi:MAG: 50S ribosomal protein L23 [Coxiella sp. DG_40]|nr:MAG: 50S ribosomal protein L23 [Coxiella sp. DG_40]
MNGEERLLQVVLGTVVSEKSTRIGADRHYVFKVIANTTKSEVKKAVELLFNVNVAKVRISNVKSKVRKFGQIEGRCKGWKKAYVTLQEGQSIDFGVKG